VPRKVVVDCASYGVDGEGAARTRRIWSSSRVLDFHHGPRSRRLVGLGIFADLIRHRLARRSLGAGCAGVAEGVGCDGRPRKRRGARHMCRMTFVSAWMTGSSMVIPRMRKIVLSMFRPSGKQWNIGAGLSCPGLNCVGLRGVDCERQGCGPVARSPAALLYVFTASGLRRSTRCRAGSA
jgi:hypothetical protein